MVFEESGRRTLKMVLGFLVEMYSAVADGYSGIRAIRFMNGTDDPRTDNIRVRDEVDKVVDNHQFEGLTRIGTSLMVKILEHFVFSDEPGIPRRMRRLGRPLLITIITDGVVSPPTFMES